MDHQAGMNPTQRKFIQTKELMLRMQINILEGQWLQIEKCFLPSSDWMLLIEGKRLNDHHINYAQCLLRRQFTAVSGLQLTLLQGKKQPGKIKSRMQIVYLSNRLHWCVASTISCPKNEVKFDSKCCYIASPQA